MSDVPWLFDQALMLVEDTELLGPLRHAPCSSLDTPNSVVSHLSDWKPAWRKKVLALQLGNSRTCLIYSQIVVGSPHILRVLSFMPKQTCLLRSQRQLCTPHVPVLAQKDGRPDPQSFPLSPLNTDETGKQPS